MLPLKPLVIGLSPYSVTRGIPGPAPINWPMPLASITTLSPTVMFHAWKISPSLGSVSGSTSISALPPSSRYFDNHRYFLRKKGLRWSGNHQYVAVGRHAVLRDQVDRISSCRFLSSVLAPLCCIRPSRSVAQRFFAVAA